MKHSRVLILLVLLVVFSQLASGGGLSNHRAANVASLISAIVKRYSPSGYSRIEIGSTAYLIKGQSGKVLQRKKIKSWGGMCGRYAAVRMVVSDPQMREQSEGEGSLWKLSSGRWKEFGHTSAGDWQCHDVKSIPRSVRKCLGADECF